jgi:hypothetical protein
VLINRLAAAEAFLPVGAMSKVPERFQRKPHFPLDQTDDVVEV